MRAFKTNIKAVKFYRVPNLLQWKFPSIDRTIHIEFLSGFKNTSKKLPVTRELGNIGIAQEP